MNDDNSFYIISRVYLCDKKVPKHFPNFFKGVGIIPLSKTKKGILICIIIMVLVLILNLIATVMVNTMWDDLWKRVGGEDNEEVIWIQGDNTEYLLMVYNRGVERIWNFILTYFILILILSIIEIFGFILIFKGSSDFGEKHHKMAKWGLILLIIWFFLDHVFGTFGSPYSVAVFNILGALSFAGGIVLLIYTITVGKSRMVLMGGGFVYFLGKTIGSSFSQWTTITGSIISVVAMIFIIIVFLITFIKIGRPDFSTGESLKRSPHRVRVLYVSRKPQRSFTEQEKVIADNISPFQTMKEAQRGFTVDMYSETFNISEHHATLIYEAGYISKDDLEFATIEELLFVDGMNPTVARKIMERI